VTCQHHGKGSFGRDAGGVVGEGHADEVELERVLARFWEAVEQRNGGIAVVVVVLFACHFNATEDGAAGCSVTFRGGACRDDKGPDHRSLHANEQHLRATWCFFVNAYLGTYEHMLLKRQSTPRRLSASPRRAARDRWRTHHPRPRRTLCCRRLGGIRWRSGMAMRARPHSPCLSGFRGSICASRHHLCLVWRTRSRGTSRLLPVFRLK
jgi:hypothetical protein